MWKITERQLTTEDGESYTGYGVTMGECTIDDITPNRAAITRLTDQLNKYEASPSHIYDILENYLAEL